MAVGDGWDFSISFPEGWFVTDPDVTTRPASIAGAVDAYMAARPDVEIERDELVEVLLGLAGDADEKGALVAATLWDVAGDVVVLGNVMVFEGGRVTGDSVDAEIAALKSILSQREASDASKRDVRVVQLGAGKAVRLRMLTETDRDEHGDTLALDVIEHWLPVPGHPDSIIVSASTPNLALADDLAESFDWIAQNVELEL